MTATMIPSPNTGSGSMKSLKLKFQKEAAYSKEESIHEAIKTLKQVYKQCKKQIPAFALNPIQKAIDEMCVIFRQGQEELAMTQGENIVVVHADKMRTFGKRYTLERDPDGSRISVVVTGSNKLHDLFINVGQSGNVLMGYKGLARNNPKMKERVVEVQLSVFPSNEFESVYTYYYSTSRKDHLKKANMVSWNKMELKFSRLTLSPVPHILTGNDSSKVCKITAREFKNMFGVKLVKTPTVADKKSYTQDLKNINNSYCKLRLYLEGGHNLSYDEGIKSGDLRYVSKKSLLARILDQFHLGKRHLPKVVIVKVNDRVGNGLIAGEFISPGTIIGEYSGEIAKMAPIAAANESKEGKDNTYFAPYSLDAVPGSEMFVIDAKICGNPTRFINHSDDNSNAAWVPVFDGGKFRLIIAAIKPIAEGKQILLKYRSSYWLNSRIPNPVPL